MITYRSNRLTGCALVYAWLMAAGCVADNDPEEHKDEEEGLCFFNFWMKIPHLTGVVSAELHHPGGFAEVLNDHVFLNCVYIGDEEEARCFVQNKLGEEVRVPQEAMDD